MTWSELHSQSERLAIEAQLAMQSRNKAQAIELYKRASEAELQGFELLDKTKARTRGITAVSVVALLYKAGEYMPAEKFAYANLADPLIPEFARDDLRNLVQAIWTESAKEKAGVTFMPGQVLVSVKGGDVITGGAPLDLVVDKVQAIQAIFFRVIEHSTGMIFRKAGRPIKELQDACRPWLFQSAPGSYQFAVAIQQPEQTDLFRRDLEPAQVADTFLQIVSASSCDDSERLKQLVPEEDYRNTFLKLTRNLTPTGKTFEKIEIRGSADIRPLSIDVEARSNINKQLRAKADAEKEKDAVIEELRGVLRAVHLDKDWLEITVDEQAIRIVDLKDAVDDVIGPMINRTVVVRAVRDKNKIKFVDIELAE